MNVVNYEYCWHFVNLLYSFLSDDYATRYGRLCTGRSKRHSNVQGYLQRDKLDAYDDVLAYIQTVRWQQVLDLWIPVLFWYASIQRNHNECVFCVRVFIDIHSYRTNRGRFLSVSRQFFISNWPRPSWSAEAVLEFDWFFSVVTISFQNSRKWE